ncbi:AI-2E family transporter [Halobacteriales archaeon QH_10_65_19]|nr:MAG: AI-2E family transporter [Halobacteriales archaeon QH_10_65_19]
MQLDRELSGRLAIGVGVLALLAVTAYVVLAFIASVVVAVFLYYAVRPIFRFLDRFRLGRRSRAALSLLLFGIPFLVLIAYTVAVLALEIRDFLEAQGVLESAVDRVTAELNVAQLDLEELQTLVSDTDSVPSADFLLETVVDASSAIGGALLQGFIIVAAVYYMLVDGPRLRSWFLDTFDDSDVFRMYVREVDSELSQTLFGNIVNIFVTGITAILTFYGYNLLVAEVIEVPYPGLTGALVGVGTLIPVVGIKLVYIPVILGVGARAVLAGELGLLLPVGVLFVVSAVLLDFIPDIFARARFSGDRTHNGLLMFAYITGPALFGFYGLFLAPILLIVTVESVQLLLPYALSGDSSAPTQSRLSEYGDGSAAPHGETSTD